MTNQTSNFNDLSPDVILELVEGALGTRFTSLCRPYTSYINRVYELQTADGESIVAKFYRPGRWDVAALQDEHDFLLELSGAEVPVIAPLKQANGKTLASHGDFFFTLFPKKGGRNCSELLEEDWLQVGRLLGRVHAIGATKPAENRVIWTPEKTTRMHADVILNGNFISNKYVNEYRAVTKDFIQLAEPLFDEKTFLRIHGDFHYANLIYRPEESFYMIDFDDMAMGPAIQDFWMLLPGYRSEVQREINLFVEGYETFRPFQYSDLKLVEILRAMRYIHFSAWCAHQVKDGGFLQGNPNWGTDAYWVEEINDLKLQMNRIQDELKSF